VRRGLVKRVAECECWTGVQCQEKISAVQPVGGSELQRVVDWTRDEDITRTVMQRMPAVQ
jgi:hypothetical protein